MQQRKCPHIIALKLNNLFVSLVIYEYNLFLFEINYNLLNLFHPSVV